MEVHFLTVEDVVVLHRQAIDLYGGAYGIRDRGLLESAVLAPRQTFDGEFLYRNLAEMDAALWHGLVQNHPFIDGNKRIGLRAADVFLTLNGLDLRVSPGEVVGWTLRVATGKMDRAELARLVSENA